MQQLSQILPRALYTRLPARSRLTVVVIVLAAAIAVPLALSSGGHGAAAPKPGSRPPRRACAMTAARRRARRT